MAVHTRQTVVKTWVEYVLPNPTNWAEFDKAAASCRQELEAAGRLIDRPVRYLEPLDVTP